MRKLLVIIGMWWFTERMYAATISYHVKGDISSTARIQKIIPKLQVVLNSPELKDEILNYEFTSTGLTSSQIEEKLLGKDWSLDIAFGANNCKVLGWTYLGAKTLYFNTCNFSKREDASIAGTICHEYSHQLGFRHKSAKDSKSVPYKFGNICKELFNGQKN